MSGAGAANGRLGAITTAEATIITPVAPAASVDSRATRLTAAVAHATDVITGAPISARSPTHPARRASMTLATAAANASASTIRSAGPKHAADLRAGHPFTTSRPGCDREGSYRPSHRLEQAFHRRRAGVDCDKLVALIHHCVRQRRLAHIGWAGRTVVGQHDD